MSDNVYGNITQDEFFSMIVGGVEKIVPLADVQEVIQYTDVNLNKQINQNEFRFAVLNFSSDPIQLILSLLDNVLYIVTSSNDGLQEIKSIFSDFSKLLENSVRTSPFDTVIGVKRNSAFHGIFYYPAMGNAMTMLKFISLLNMSTYFSDKSSDKTKELLEASKTLSFEEFIEVVRKQYEEENNVEEDDV